MITGTNHLWHPGLSLSEFEPVGKQLVAKQKIQKDELLIVWGGKPVGRTLLDTYPQHQRSLSVQIDDYVYLVPDAYELGDCINHSCDPNAGIKGQITVVALKDIEIGETVAYDYAMTDTENYDEFNCLCLQNNCRKRITGSDWQNSTLQEKYKGYFSTNVQTKINEYSSV